STRSKAKIESSKIIKDVVPVTTIQPSNLKSITAAEKKGKKRTAEKKKEIIRVSDAISPSGNKSEKGTSKRKRRDYKSRILLSMSDLVFQSNVDTSEKISETIEEEPQNPKLVSEVVETIISTVEVEPDIADKSPTIAEMVTKKSTHV
ncbi:hypothetical protein L195_g056387, partial [Trifolium pratense]